VIDQGARSHFEDPAGLPRDLLIDHFLDLDEVILSLFYQLVEEPILYGS